MVFIMLFSEDSASEPPQIPNPKGGSGEGRGVAQRTSPGQVPRRGTTVS